MISDGYIVTPETVQIVQQIPHRQLLNTSSAVIKDIIFLLEENGVQLDMVSPVLFSIVRGGGCCCRWC